MRKCFNGLESIRRFTLSGFLKRPQKLWQNWKISSSFCGVLTKPELYEQPSGPAFFRDPCLIVLYYIYVVTKNILEAFLEYVCKVDHVTLKSWLTWKAFSCSPWQSKHSRSVYFKFWLVLASWNGFEEILKI